MKAVEDQARVMKGALESRIGARIPSTHPVMKWLIEYVGVVLNKYAIQPDGKSAYHSLHGKKVSERLVEFGEVVMHDVPKKRRSKLDQRWTTGVFLGTTMHSNENYVALTNGCVVRAEQSLVYVLTIGGVATWSSKFAVHQMLHYLETTQSSRAFQIPTPMPKSLTWKRLKVRSRLNQDLINEPVSPSRTSRSLARRGIVPNAGPTPMVTSGSMATTITPRNAATGFTN